jgi:hypothetical protein
MRRWCNYFCGGKTITITYSECVAAALIIQHKMGMLLIVICDLPCSTVFFHTCLSCYTSIQNVLDVTYSSLLKETKIYNMALLVYIIIIQQWAATLLCTFYNKLRRYIPSNKQNMYILRINKITLV